MGNNKTWNKICIITQSVIGIVALLWILLSMLGLFVLPIVTLIKYIVHSPVVVWKAILLEILFLFVLATQNWLKNLATERTYYMPNATKMQIIFSDVVTLLKPIAILTIEIGTGVLLII